MKERVNSFDESPETRIEGQNHFENIEPVQTKRNRRLLHSPESSLNSTNFAKEFKDVGIRDTFLFE